MSEFIDFNVLTHFFPFKLSICYVLNSSYEQSLIYKLYIKYERILTIIIRCFKGWKGSKKKTVFYAKAVIRLC